MTDRKRPSPPAQRPRLRPWEAWYGPDGEYLGQRSARTGPDPVRAEQRCGCPQCKTQNNGGEL